MQNPHGMAQTKCWLGLGKPHRMGVAICEHTCVMYPSASSPWFLNSSATCACPWSSA